MPRASPEAVPLKLTVVAELVAAAALEEVTRPTVTAPEQEPAATVCAAEVIVSAAGDAVGEGLGDGLGLG